MEDVDWPPLHSLPLTALSQVVDGDADDDSVEPRRIVSSSLDSDDDRSRFRCLFSSDRDLRRLFSIDLELGVIVVVMPPLLTMSALPLPALAHSSVTVVVLVVVAVVAVIAMDAAVAELGLRAFSFFILLILFEESDCLSTVDSFALLAAMV